VIVNVKLVNNTFRKEKVGSSSPPSGTTLTGLNPSCHFFALRFVNKTKGLRYLRVLALPVFRARSRFPALHVFGYLCMRWS